MDSKMLEENKTKKNILQFRIAYVWWSKIHIQKFFKEKLKKTMVDMFDLETINSTNRSYRVKSTHVLSVIINL